jgi:bifunctional DNA-binding transcriptional regulator/antitoxin component of YhaV-PrlF toxin-antitoxin module
MARETKKKIYKTTRSYVIVVPKDWVEMHDLHVKKEVIMIIEPDKITIMPEKK